MGMGVALMLDQSQLADPRIGLAQAHSDLGKLLLSRKKKIDKRKRKEIML
jgi:hypothetical protein